LAGEYNNFYTYKPSNWFITINLERFNTDSAYNQILDNEPILGIKILYYYQNKINDSTFVKDSSYILFDSIAKNNFNGNLESLGSLNFKGFALKYDIVQDTTIEFKITRYMLPVNELYLNSRNLSITSRFKAKKNINQENEPWQNREFYFGINMSSGFIDSVNIIVTYYGNCDINLNWIRIDNENAYYLFKGNYDAMNRSILQAFHDTIVNINNQSHIYNFFRFYGQDTETRERMENWAQLRYLNQVTGGMGITRDMPIYPKLYDYYTKCPNRWVGIFYAANDYQMPTPYAVNCDESWQSMGMKYGYLGAYGMEHFPDTLHSEYETHVINTIPPDDNYYNNEILTSPTVLQEMWEKSLYDSYYNPNNKISEMLYSGKPWWLYHLLYNVQNENEHIVFKYYRPKTGEEIRMLLNSSLIRGCKGFIYDGDENYHFPDCHMGNMGIGDGTRISDTSDFFSNWVGADYIDNVNNTWNAYPYADLTALSTTMGVPENKIYIGTRSLRSELYSFHSKIRRADEELMKLRLIASYSKGYRVQQNHHPDYSANVLSQYLAWDTTNNMIDTNRFSNNKIKK